MACIGHGLDLNVGDIDRGQSNQILRQHTTRARLVTPFAVLSL